MDRQRLELLTIQGNALSTTLIGIHDSNENARSRCLNIAAEVRGLVKAFSNLSKALYDPQLEARPAFTRIVDRLLLDNSKIVQDLRSQLADVRSKQEQYDSAVRAKRWVPGRHKTAHLLVNFLGRETTALRLQQVIYAVSVLDVILGVVLHAKTLGVPSTQQDAQAAIRDQVARLRAESEAKALVFQEERRIGDKYVVSSLWLSTVTWHADAAQQPPFEILALQWFEIVPGHDEQDQVSSGADARRLTRIVMQLQQDMREQAHKYQEQIQDHQKKHDNLRTWAEGNIGQLEFSQQKTARDAAAKVEELRSQLEVQQQKLESDATEIERLEYARKSWAAHYQKQSEKLQQIEGDMRGLQKCCAQQQARLDILQAKYDKALQINEALRQRLNQSEMEKDELAESYHKLQTRYSAALQSNKKWTAFYEQHKDRDALISRLRAEVDSARDEVSELKSDLIDMQGTRDRLRNSLTQTEEQRDAERSRADRYKERLSTPRRECPNSFDNRQSDRRRSSSRHRSDSATSMNSRSSSRDPRSRASSSTYVDDNASDHEFYDDRVRRKSNHSKTSKVEAWFSPLQRQREPAMV